MDLKSTYNKIAREWVRDHSYDTWWMEGTDKFLSFLPNNSLILDVGCGAGVKTRYLMDKGHRVKGVDFSEEMVAIAKERVPDGDFSVRDIKQPLSPEQNYDGVFAQAVLLHIPKNEIRGVLKNITSPLKAGGYLYVSVKEVWPGQADEEVLRENDYGYEYERFFSYYSLDELREYFQQVGMEIVHEAVTPSGKTNWVQVIAKKLH